MKGISRTIGNIFGRERENLSQPERAPSKVPDASEAFTLRVFILAAQNRQDVEEFGRRVTEKSVHVTFLEGVDFGLFHIAVRQKKGDIGADLAVFVDSEKFMAIKNQGGVVLDIAAAVETQVRELALQGVPLNRGEIDPIQLLGDVGIKVELDSNNGGGA